MTHYRILDDAKAKLRACERAYVAYPALGIVF